MSRLVRASWIEIASSARLLSFGLVEACKSLVDWNGTCASSGRAVKVEACKSLVDWNTIGRKLKRNSFRRGLQEPRGLKFLLLFCYFPATPVEACKSLVDWNPSLMKQSAQTLPVEACKSLVDWNDFVIGVYPPLQCRGLQEPRGLKWTIWIIMKKSKYVEACKSLIH